MDTGRRLEPHFAELSEGDGTYDGTGRRVTCQADGIRQSAPWRRCCRVRSAVDDVNVLWVLAWVHRLGSVALIQWAACSRAV
jgi:hypothetical protein